MKKIFGKCFMVAALVAAVGTVSSCKDYNDEMNTENRIQDANLKKQIEELLAKHNADIDAAKDERDRIEGELDQHIADAEAKYATKAELEAAKAELVAADAALKAELEAADAALKTEIQNKINDIQNQINGINTQLGTLEDKINLVRLQLWHSAIVILPSWKKLLLIWLPLQLRLVIWKKNCRRLQPRMS